MNKAMTDKEIRKFCVEKRLDGLSINEIVDCLAHGGYKGWHYLRVKNATRPKNNPKIAAMLEAKRQTPAERVDDTVEDAVKEGGTERKPKYELSEGFYTIYYGKNKKLRISESDVDKAFKLYTLGNMTMSEVALECSLSRAEFYALKSSFSITKTEIPITPERIDTMTADDIAEELRIEKKRLALQKFQQGKFKDLESENKKFNELDYWYKMAVDRINKIQPKVFKPTIPSMFKDDDIERVLSICDIHAGTKIDSPWGKFNLDIMRKRFEDLTEQILIKTEPCKITIFSGGDNLAGKIHASIVKMSDNFIDSIFAVTECLISTIGTLISAGYDIDLLPILGNHGAADSDPKARTLADNYERLIVWAIKLKLADVKNFKIIEPTFNMGLIEIHNYSLICVHGDQAGTKGLADFERLFRSKNVKEILSAHIHHQKSEEFCGVTVYHQPSFVGADHYSISKGLVSEPGCRLIEYDRNGRLCEHYLRFKVSFVIVLL